MVESAKGWANVVMVTGPMARARALPTMLHDNVNRGNVYYYKNHAFFISFISFFFSYENTSVKVIKQYSFHKKI